MKLQIASFNSGLLELISQKHNETAKSIIERENLYNVIDSTKNTLLHLAAKMKNIEITKYLIDSGSDVDAQNDVGQTPLMLTVNHEREDICEILFNAGADIDILDNYGRSALSMISEQEWISDKILKLFLQKLKINSLNNREVIANKLINAKWSLLSVVRLNNVDLTKAMLQIGDSTKINVNKFFYDETALHGAVKSIDVKNVQVLLNYGANVNIVDSDQRTPLSYVYDNYNIGNERHDERLQIAKMLVDLGAVLFSVNPKNVPHPYDIFEYGNSEVIKLLLKTDIDLLAHNADGDTVVHALAANKNPGVIKELQGKSFDVEARNWYGITPLMKAAHYGNDEAVEYLLKEGANVNAVHKGNYSAIHCAIANMSTEREEKYANCVQILLEYNANVQELQDDSNKTVLGLLLSRNYSRLDKIVIHHLALHQARGLKITKLTQTEINEDELFKIQFEISKQVLKKSVYRRMTVFEFLTASDRKFERYVINEELVLKVQEFIGTLSSLCRYFADVLQKRTSKALRMVTLRKEASFVICEIIMGRGYERFYVAADFIVDYLEQQDLENLISLSL